MVRPGVETSTKWKFLRRATVLVLRPLLGVVASRATREARSESLPFRKFDSYFISVGTWTRGDPMPVSITAAVPMTAELHLQTACHCTETP